MIAKMFMNLMHTTNDLEISGEELRQKLAANDGTVIVDVRDPWEFALVHIDSAISLPLAELEVRMTELAKDAAIITLCHHGVRSLRAAKMMHDKGFADVKSLAGGIDAWARTIDLSLKVY